MYTYIKLSPAADNNVSGKSRYRLRPPTEYAMLGHGAQTVQIDRYCRCKGLRKGTERIVHTKFHAISAKRLHGIE